jgi:similar to stage IV sporulation protein
MERLSDLARGFALVQAVGAEPTRLLDICVSEGIEFWGAYPEDEFTLYIKVRLKALEKLLSLEEESRCELLLIEKRGGPVMMKRARRRYVLWVLPAVLLLLFVISSFFTWEIEIHGNETVSETEILNALEDAGVYIGSFHPAYTSDNIRSRVLVKIPELKFISVSVFGSRAYVQVRERTDIPELYDEFEKVKIVAEYPGIIEDIKVYKGEGKFTKGQTVIKGETLIDGAVSSTFSETKLLHAEGEVSARTWHELTVFMPEEYTLKEYSGKTASRYSLILGNKRINFYQSSGILKDECDIIISEDKLSMDGVFTLPVSLVCRQSLYYETIMASHSGEYMKMLLQERANAELLQRIGEKGEVISSRPSFKIIDGFGVLTLRAECRQEIGLEKPMGQQEIEMAQAAGEETANG